MLCVTGFHLHECQNFLGGGGGFSLRSADAFPVVASLPPLFFGGREATTGNASALRRLGRFGRNREKYFSRRPPLTDIIPDARPRDTFKNPDGRH